MFQVGFSRTDGFDDNLYDLVAKEESVFALAVEKGKDGGERTFVALVMLVEVVIGLVERMFFVEGIVGEVHTLCA